ncbi:hypothetical protein [Corynebacterium sp. H130]|uniref:hypothetical protein n=1 Tax=Corynebacterium sp. H130 TaxID=3133444 RepID=UPI003099E5B8
MTRPLLRLQRALWRRSIGANSRLILMIVVVYLYALGAALSLFAVAWGPLADAQATVLPALCGIGVLTYLLVSAFMPDGENQLQPETLSALPISSRTLFKAHAVVAVLNSRGLLVLLLTTITGVVAALTLGFSWALIPMMFLQLVTTLVMGETWTCLLARQTDRKVEERRRTLASVAGVVIVLGINVLNGMSAHLTKPLFELGAVLAWTPFAAPSGVIASLIAGNWWAALGQFVITVVSLIGLTWMWYRTLSNRLVAPLNSRVVRETAKVSSSLLVPLAPRNRFGIVYSRALRYFRRDTRLGPQLFMLPIVAVLFGYQGVMFGNWYAGAVTMAFLVATVVANDFGYDGPANWVHLVTAVPAKTLVFGRHLAMITPHIITLMLYCIVMIALTPNKLHAVVTTVVALALFATGAAVGMLFSVHNPFPVAEPGTNPWQDRSGYSSAAFVSAFGALLGCWIPLLPGLVVIVYGAITHSSSYLVAGAGICALVAAIAYYMVSRHCIKYVDEHYPEIFYKVRAWCK